ncbi:MULTISPECIES: hypothetical protein [unclassified Sphingobacterium]|uniref:alpha-glutamyl/putrescinyl thymine pyrophosphorylase clade 3 protein n=1 Tax=unclassified Sphingobacterium TaxID=2609468 RepID=UPI0020C4B5D4|nr:MULTISPECIES: hypothetical protein [unclassified Sphingobacterium]
MKRPGLYNKIKDSLDEYQLTTDLPGINTPANENSFISQLIDSISRVKFIETIKSRPISQIRKDPTSNIFDPIRASILYNQEGNKLEAFWLIFLFTHFGKHNITKYGLLKCFYSKNNSADIFNYLEVEADITECKFWMNNNQINLKNSGKFSNHRKYQSLNSYSPNGTGDTIESFINWVGDNFNDFLARIPLAILNDRYLLFEYLYKEASKNIIGFGRLACFDFITMLGKVGIFECEPKSPYINCSTGPLKGTKLLFNTSGNTTPKDLDDFLKDLGDHLENDLGLKFTMQIMEDAVCNWQKSPQNYIPFNG